MSTAPATVPTPLVMSMGQSDTILRRIVDPELQTGMIEDFGFAWIFLSVGDIDDRAGRHDAGGYAVDIDAAFKPKAAEVIPGNRQGEQKNEDDDPSRFEINHFQSKNQ